MLNLEMEFSQMLMESDAETEDEKVLKLFVDMDEIDLLDELALEVKEMAIA